MEINKVYQGDSAELMKELPGNFIDLTITSPPYDNLRDYKGYSFDFETIAKELFRVTKEGGVVVWVVGDATINGSETTTSFKQAIYFKEIGFNLHDTMIYQKNNYPFPPSNRYFGVFEYMFVFSKDKPKTFNPIRVKTKNKCGIRNTRQQDGSLKKMRYETGKDLRNKENVWVYTTGSNHSTKDKIAFQHPAIFPEQLAKDHIISWSNKGDLVFDPFAGSGTTLKMAMLNDRNYLGFEISAEYCSLINQRIGSNLSGFIHTSATPTFAKQKAFNMDLEENSAEFSQISANAETSPNPNIMFNLRGRLQSCEKL